MRESDFPAFPQRAHEAWKDPFGRRSWVDCGRHHSAIVASSPLSEQRGGTSRSQAVTNRVVAERRGQILPAMRPTGIAGYYKILITRSSRDVRIDLVPYFDLALH